MNKTKKKKSKKPSRTSRLHEADLVRALIDNIPDHIYIKDANHRFILANKVVVKNLGAKSLEEIKGKTDLDFFPMEHAQKYFDDEEHVLAGNPVINKEEFNINQTTQKPEWLTTTKVAIHNRKNQVIGLAGINRDITELKKLREKERAYVEAVRRELSLAATIQKGFLPESLPVIEGWELGRHFIPAEEIGGDFYDAFRFGSEMLVLAVGDVSGHSISAALFMSHVITLMRAFTEQLLVEGKNPLGALELVNRHICRHHQTGGMATKFVTLFLATINTKTGEVEYVNAGHPPPFITPVEAPFQRLKPTGPAIGIMDPAAFAVKKIQMSPGDIMTIFTDGITESRNPKDELYSDPRLAKIVQTRHSSPDAMIASVIEDITLHSEGSEQADDITMLALKRK